MNGHSRLTELVAIGWIQAHAGALPPTSRCCRIGPDYCDYVRCACRHVERIELSTSLKEKKNWTERRVVGLANLPKFCAETRGQRPAAGWPARWNWGLLHQSRAGGGVPIALRSRETTEFEARLRSTYSTTEYMLALDRVEGIGDGFKFSTDPTIAGHQSRSPLNQAGWPAAVRYITLQTQKLISMASICIELDH